MEPFEERLAEEVRRHKYLYDHSCTYRMNSPATMSTWMQIGESLDEDPVVCMKRWKALRDRFVRLKKKIKANIIDPECEEHKLGLPIYYTTLSWLHRYVKHRKHERHFVQSNEIEVDPVTLDGPSSPRGLSPSRSSTDLEQFEVPSDGCGDCGECDGCSLGFKPQTSRKRKCVEDPDYLKPFNNHMEQHKVDAYDRYAQTVADFMRGLSRRRCIIFKKRVNDLMYEMDLAELEDFTQS